MSQEYLNSPCPICDENYIKNADPNGLMSEIDCARCGKYKIGRRLLDDKPWQDVGHLVSAWIRRENKSGFTPVVGADVLGDNIDSPEWWSTRFKHMGFPETTNEKLDALLLAYAESVSDNYQESVKTDRPELISTVAAKNIDEIKGLTDLLVEMGRINEKKGPYGNATVARTISAQGWLQIDELRKANVASNNAFIAMWFSESTEEFRDAATAAVEFCGYRPIIVDQEEYSGFIMDQVITLLKQAKFVIADFTCLPETIEDKEVKNGVRGGVYWESGLAYGLGKPLIHTCENTPESKARIHFDVDQYNTIYWKQDDLDTNIRPIEAEIKNPTFAEKLVARILTVVGKGSYTPE